MVYILKLIFQFIVFIFFYSKEELNYKSKHFNPIKILVLFIFISSIALNFFLISLTDKLYLKIQTLMAR